MIKAQSEGHIYGGQNPFMPLSTVCSIRRKRHQKVWHSLPVGNKRSSAVTPLCMTTLINSGRGVGVGRMVRGREERVGRRGGNRVIKMSHHKNTDLSEENGNWPFIV